MNVFKPRSLLLALRMRQISIPLVFLEDNFFIMKNECLRTRIILKNHEIGRSLVENDNSTSASAMITKSTATMTNITMENPAVTSE